MLSTPGYIPLLNVPEEVAEIIAQELALRVLVQIYVLQQLINYLASAKDNLWQM